VQRSVDALAAAHVGADAERPRLVHRLDKDTSGVLLLARTAGAAAKLSENLKAEGTEKVYWAITAARPPRRHGRIEVPLAKRKRGGGEKMGETPDGKPAVTAYRVVATPRRDLAWVALSPLTGRTHQLRAHLALAGTPILGDGKYGGRAAFPGDPGVRRLHLHARRITVPHPDDGTTLRITAGLPEHMVETFDRLGLDVAQGEDADPLAP
jgi:23S rRNA pseudouridine955/2504/2580 synthase